MDINLWAVLVSTIVAFVIGWLWYGPLFGKTWMALMGWTPEKMEAMKADPAGKRKMQQSYLIQFIGALIMAFVVAHAVMYALIPFSAALGMPSVATGIIIGFMNWIGLVAPTTVGMVLWEGKPWKYWWIVAGYWLVVLMVMGAIFAIW